MFKHYYFKQESLILSIRGVLILIYFLLGIILIKTVHSANCLVRDYFKYSFHVEFRFTTNFLTNVSTSKYRKMSVQQGLQPTMYIFTI